jgi:hypothetical protein
MPGSYSIRACTHPVKPLEWRREASVWLFGAVDARDADQFPCQAHEFLAVDLVQYIFEHTSETGVCDRFGVRLRQLKPARSGSSSLHSHAVTST